MLSCVSFAAYVGWAIRVNFRCLDGEACKRRFEWGVGCARPFSRLRGEFDVCPRLRFLLGVLGGPPSDPTASSSASSSSSMSPPPSDSSSPPECVYSPSDFSSPESSSRSCGSSSFVSNRALLAVAAPAGRFLGLGMSIIHADVEVVVGSAFSCCNTEALWSAQLKSKNKPVRASTAYRQ